MHYREEYDGPCSGDMELDAVVKGDNVIERCLPKKRDKVATYWEEDESNVDMENQSGRTSQGCGIPSGTDIATIKVN